MKITEKEINWINVATNELHDEVASINEEFVDGKIRLAVKHIDALIEKARDLRTNLQKNE